MIPEVTETIVSNCSVVVTYPPIWASMVPTITGAIIGGTLAAGAGFLVAHHQGKVEKTERRRWIASGLLLDIQRTKSILKRISVDSPEEALMEILGLSDIPPFKQGMIYPLNGFYSVHYCEILILDQKLTKIIVDIYNMFDILDAYLKYIQKKPELHGKISNDQGFIGILGKIIEVIEAIDTAIPLLESVVHE